MRNLQKEAYRVMVLFVIITLIGTVFLFKPSLAQVRPKPDKRASFTCGPHLLTYEVYAANGQRGKGVRCVRARAFKTPAGSNTYHFGWYGEGDWGQGPYRHIGYAAIQELMAVTAADIYGNGEKFGAAYPATLDDSPTNIKLKRIVGAWPAPNEIHLDGGWKEVWKRVSATAYTPLPPVTTCGPHFQEYQAQLYDPKMTDRGVRCVSKLGAVWFGTGKWGANRYVHLGVGGIYHDNHGAVAGVEPGEASDICHPTQSSFCNTTPPNGIQFTRDESNFKLGGVWNELWVPKP
jgi:hypothetical protein